MSFRPFFSSRYLISSGGGPPITPLEPLNPDPNVPKVNVTVDAEPRQTWIGLGVGANAFGEAASLASQWVTHKNIIMRDLGASVLRIWTPEQPTNAITNFQTIYNAMATATAGGVPLKVHATSYYYRVAVEGNPWPSPEAYADQVAITNASVPINYLDIQNEKDVGGAIDALPWTPTYADTMQRIRARLDTQGASNVKLVGMAWNHSGSANAVTEYNILNSAGMLPSTSSPGAVVFGGGR